MIIEELEGKRNRERPRKLTSQSDTVKIFTCDRSVACVATVPLPYPYRFQNESRLRHGAVRHDTVTATDGCDTVQARTRTWYATLRSQSYYFLLQIESESTVMKGHVK